MLIGYARVSTVSQNLDRQIEALIKAGVAPDRIYTDKLSGKNADRPKLREALAACREGDVLVVAELYRVVARNTLDLLVIVGDLNVRGVGFKPLDMPELDTTSPLGEAVLTIFGALGQLQRRLIVSATEEGLAIARAKGHVGGRPRSMTEADAKRARVLLEHGSTGEEVADMFGCNRATVYRALKRLDERELRDAG